MAQGNQSLAMLRQIQGKWNSFQLIQWRYHASPPRQFRHGPEGEKNQFPADYGNQKRHVPLLDHYEERIYIL